MKTLIEKANEQSIRKAAQILKSGGLVAFPTETVYGLGADALNAKAVKKIYLAKGRPSDNPLIVHIAQLNYLNEIAKDISAKAIELTKKFWPGPLTIILNKKDCIPYETSGALDTIAVRFPANSLAQKLINTANLPIAAPSANISGKPSCTHFSHVINDLDGKIDMIIYEENEKEFSFGLESTIIDMTLEIPVMLRPGAVTLEMLKDCIGDVIVADNLLNDNEHPKAPGMKYKHYSPKAEVIIVSGNLENMSAKINELILQNKNKKIGVLASDQTKNLYNNCLVLSAGNRNNLLDVAENLFSILREFDLNDIEIIYAESFPKNDIGFAIMNRLQKAADYKIIRV